jgi:hypothetical protein
MKFGLLLFSENTGEEIGKLWLSLVSGLQCFFSTHFAVMQRLARQLRRLALFPSINLFF